jgi:hypothetical protein
MKQKNGNTTLQYISFLQTSRKAVFRNVEKSI